MIDLDSEQLIALCDVPRFLPARSNGKRLHISAIYRWVQRGVRGVRLEVLRIGGATYTSREALQRFAAPSAAVDTSPLGNSATRQQEIDRAIRHLDEMLYPQKSICNPRSKTVRGLTDRVASKQLSATAKA